MSKIPHGYKRCPACQGLVKGPRTKVCSCGHEFVKGAAKPAKVAKPTKAVAVAPKSVAPQGIVTPDPWVFDKLASPDYAGVMLPNPQKKGDPLMLCGYVRRSDPRSGAEAPKRAARMVEFAYNLDVPDAEISLTGLDVTDTMTMVV